MSLLNIISKVGDKSGGRQDLKGANRVFSTPVAWPVVTMETVGQTNPVRRDGMVWALSAHYIMLIRPQQALPLVRIY